MSVSVHELSATDTPCLLSPLRQQKEKQKEKEKEKCRWHLAEEVEGVAVGWGPFFFDRQPNLEIHVRAVLGVLTTTGIF